MIKPDWNKFNAKFSEDQQGNFEWFCNLLFCIEFDKKLGVSGYYNQRHIETKPITKNGEVIVWQAKYFATPTMAGHKPEIIKLIKGAKKDYPEITKIIFYTNVNWSQGKKQNDTKEKLEVDKVAKDEGVQIDWDHMQNFFKSSFVSVDNEQISKHFFNLDKSNFDLVKDLRRHSENILSEINTSISYNDQTIEIDRTKILDNLRLETNKAVIINGSGGVGKTAIIKKYYEQIKNTTPFYIFKASEFEIHSVNNLFEGFGFVDFINAHKNIIEKIVVIDSAERLIDLKDRDPVKEFLKTLIDEKWKIIFTTRESYLKDLGYEFFEIYNILPSYIKIDQLGQSELKNLSTKYSFTYPKDERLVKLLQSHFYLNEYLKFCKKDEEIDYLSFKERLWDKIVKKSKPSREICFLKVAMERAHKGQFFVLPDCEAQVLDDELRKDGLLGYETQGYFITHDIYEEWALEKSIEREFRKKIDNESFFKSIGDNLPIRRSIRNWVSEKLLLEDQEVKTFIEEVIGSKDIKSFWKDEILVSILLSDYSEHFFENFEDLLLANGQELLKKLTFILRIACKEVDDELFKQLGIENVDLFSLKYFLAKPRGLGWENLIKFAYKNLNKIGISNIYFLLPIIHDWNSKYKKGETTKLSSLIAIQYYQWIIKEDVIFSSDEKKAELFQTIIYGSSEVSGELKEIIDQVISYKWKNHRDPYYDFSKYILTKLDALPITRSLPTSILQLADLFWTYTPKDDDDHFSYGREREQNFGLEDAHFDYFPVSSYQTPIYWLLQSSLKETVDFIIDFTNRAVKHLSQTTKNSGEEVDVKLDNGETLKQFINVGLWCTYRGTQSLPCVLESMHMALEKYFIENGEVVDSKVLESWLIYLIKKSASASITSVVASITLAYPEKTFNVAKILFKTKQFFLYDTTRLVLDEGQKSSLIMLQSLGSDLKNKYHQDERLKACDAKHRTWSLEHMFLNYQIVRSKETCEEESVKRQKTLWEILDNYYKELPEKSKESDQDKTWRLYLARMDRRKMKPTVEKNEGQTIIKFNPEIDSELRKFSEKPLKRNALSMSFIPLKLWANYKIKNNEEYKKYTQYEGQPKKALKDVNRLINIIKKTKEENFLLLDYSTPADVCSVLLRDYLKDLSKKDKDICKNVVLGFVRKFLNPNYKYQVSDGSESSFCALPVIFKEFPEEKEDIKTALLLGMFNDYPINMVGSTFSAFSINAIHKMWLDNFDDAQSMLFGYLILKPKYEALRETIRDEEYKKGNYGHDESVLIQRFMDSNQVEIQKFVNNQFTLSEVGNIQQIELEILRTAFLIIPLKTTNIQHKKIVKEIISTFIKTLLSETREDRIDYALKRGFFEKLSYFILSCDKEDIPEYLKPIVDSFNSSEVFANLLEEFVSAEDYLGSYENFWTVWELFYKKVIEAGRKGDGHWYTDEIIKSYLFAKTSWKDTASNWHTLKDKDSDFFTKLTKEIEGSPSVLYSISKLLYGIGSEYLQKGIDWIYAVLSKNNNLKLDKLEVNTIFYLENILKRYIYINREKVRTTKSIKDKVIVILEFLIKNGSVVGYILRESIL